jgi:hypothetical protein
MSQVLVSVQFDATGHVSRTVPPAELSVGSGRMVAEPNKEAP